MGARGARGRADPGRALEALLWRGAELQAADRALMEAVADFKPSVAEQAAELHACTERAAQRARRPPGTMRADATGDDIRMIMCGIGSAMQMRGDAWRRYLDRHARRPARLTLDSLSST